MRQFLKEIGDRYLWLSEDRAMAATRFNTAKEAETAKTRIIPTLGGSLHILVESSSGKAIVIQLL